MVRVTSKYEIIRDVYLCPLLLYEIVLTRKCRCLARLGKGKPAKGSMWFLLTLASSDAPRGGGNGTSFGSAVVPHVTLFRATPSHAAVVLGHVPRASVSIQH